MNMDMTTHYAKRDPELTFLDECLAFIKVINARSAMLLAELDHIKKAVAEDKQEERKEG